MFIHLITPVVWPVKSAANDKWGFINAQGKVKIDFLYDEAKSFSAVFAK